MMLFECFTFALSLLLLQSYTVQYKDLVLLDTPVNVPVIGNIKQVTLSAITLPKTFTASYTTDALSVDLPDSCLSVSLKVLTKVRLNARVELCGKGHFNRTTSGSTPGNLSECYTTGFVPNEQCSLKVVIKQCPTSLTCIVLYTVNLCDYIPSVVNSSFPPPQYPALADGASPLESWLLVAAPNSIINAIGEVGPVTVSSDLLDTAMRLDFGLKMGVTIHEEYHSNDLIASISNRLFGFVNLKNLLQLIPVAVADMYSAAVVKDGPIGGTVSISAAIPPGLALQLDTIISNLMCDAEGVRCSFPIDDINLGNLRVVGLADFDFLIAAQSSSILGVTNTQIHNILQKVCSGEDGTCTFAVSDQRPNMHPPTAALVCLPLFFIIATVAIVCFNVFRQRRNPHFGRDGMPITAKRIILEDSLLCLFIGFTFSCFLCSNLTSAVTVKAGSAIHMYSFSLANTVSDLWHSGLKALAVFVVVFSGIYPYLKLLTIALFTVVFQRPDALALRIIDNIGRFSFIDTFVMLIFVTGLEIPDVADVHVLPSFFVFMAATICSIILGNVATHVWRCGTTVRRNVTSRPSTLEEVGAHDPIGDGNEGVKGTPTETEVVKSASPVSSNWFTRFLQRIWLPVAIPCGLLVVGLTLPGWILPCIQYEVEGLASIVAGPPRRFSLFQLSIAPDWACFIVTVVISLLAPVAFSCFFGAMDLASSWSACDVFLLACIAGLLQLNQFVQFIIGDMPGIYSATAHLQWPLIPMFLGVVIVWGLMAAYFFNVRTFCHRKNWTVKGPKDKMEISCETPESQPITVH